jgi:hypothetical protein
MAILKSGNDEYEVRIKRYLEKTYFDEYIKTGEREKKAATTCKRYIVGGDGVRYTTEVTLKSFISPKPSSRFQVKLTQSVTRIYTDPPITKMGSRKKSQPGWSTQMLQFEDLNFGGQDLPFEVSPWVRYLSNLFRLTLMIS